VLEEAFRAENLPYQIIGGTRFFDRSEIKDILAYLRLVENPNSEADLVRIINVPARGIGKKTIELIFDEASRMGSSAWHALSSTTNSGLPTAARQKLRQFVNLIDEWRAALAAGNTPLSWLIAS